MKIIQVGIFADRKENGVIRVQYENTASYITLPISDWLKNQQIDLGGFNRILFTEARTEDDFREVGVKAFIVSLTKEFQSLDQFTNKSTTHEYFKRKYVEGFSRFDAHFGLNLTPSLVVMLDEYFDEQLVYEREMKSRRINGLKHQVLKQYKYDVFNLVLRVVNKSGSIIKEAVLQSGKPDPFWVHNWVNKVVISDDKVQIWGSTGKVESEHSIFEV